MVMLCLFLMLRFTIILSMIFSKTPNRTSSARSKFFLFFNSGSFCSLFILACRIFTICTCSVEKVDIETCRIDSINPVAVF